MPSLPNPMLKLRPGRRSGANMTGLDIQPGHVTAVQAHANGAIVAARAAALPLPADTVREGEVLDEQALSETLRELFAGSGLSKQVRVGVANQRTVLRTLELPAITDRKELDTAVRFQAQEQVPMPLANAVLDFHPLGVHDTPAGPRQQVVLVAAQRDMVERLLRAVRQAGLRPEGIDLSAFALIRSLHRADPEREGRVLYLNVDGLTNMAIAEGPVCRFTRVVGGGLEAMASELATRCNIPVTEAREALADADLTAPVDDPAPVAADPAATEAATPAPADPEGSAGHPEPLAEDPAVPEPFAAPAEHEQPMHPSDARRADVRTVLERGIREIAGEVRNSLDFHRSQESGGEVTLVVLSGAALDTPGFADALGAELGVPVARETVGVADGALAQAGVSPQRLAVAAGLAVAEAPR